MHSLQNLGGMLQHVVAGEVAERVVDLLEAVEIEMQARAMPAGHAIARARR
ncbi:MAG: hypothetical protein QM771_13945 [Nitrospira sp.]